MPRRLHRNDDSFLSDFHALLAAREAGGGQVREAVEAIIADVCQRDDAAVVDYTEQFDKVTLKPGKLALLAEDRQRYAEQCPNEVREALEMAAERIRVFHETQKPQDQHFTDADGVKLGVRWQAMTDVGLYVPGGKASYPSSVLMNAIPAKVAGVERLVMVVPTPQGEVNAAVMAAAEIAGVDEVYPIGGAQAVAALAYGTESIRPVHQIVGPGNAYVAEAKRQVYGKVGIDMIAGPSEILVVADGAQNPEWIAADLLSQAEHDTLAQSILITDDASFADAVAHQVEKILPTLSKQAIAEESWANHGAIIVVESLDNQAPNLINQIAPEHLELAMADPQSLMPRIRHAGAIFLGSHTPEAIGDYVAGPSHVLPTYQTARFASALSVTDFMKRSSLIDCSPEAFARIAPAAETLAHAEGLLAHALSLSVRRNAKP